MALYTIRSSEYTPPESVLYFHHKMKHFLTDYLFKSTSVFFFRWSWDSLKFPGITCMHLLYCTCSFGQKLPAAIFASSIFMLFFFTRVNFIGRTLLCGLWWKPADFSLLQAPVMSPSVDPSMSLHPSTMITQQMGQLSLGNTGAVSRILGRCGKSTHILSYKCRYFNKKNKKITGDGLSTDLIPIKVSN